MCGVVQIISGAQWLKKKNKTSWRCFYHKGIIFLLSWAKKIHGPRCSWIQNLKVVQLKYCHLAIIGNFNGTIKERGFPNQSKPDMMKWLDTWGAGGTSALKHLLSCLTVPSPHNLRLSAPNPSHTKGKAAASGIQANWLQGSCWQMS